MVDGWVDWWNGVGWGRGIHDVLKGQAKWHEKEIHGEEMMLSARSIFGQSSIETCSCTSERRNYHPKMSRKTFDILKSVLQGFWGWCLCCIVIVCDGFFCWWCSEIQSTVGIRGPVDMRKRARKARGTSSDRWSSDSHFSDMSNQLISDSYGFLACCQHHLLNSNK